MLDKQTRLAAAARHLLPVGIAVLIAAIAVANWAFLSARDRRHVQSEIELDAVAALDAASHRLSKSVRSLERMAQRWEVLGGLKRDEWLADARILVEQNTAVRAILITDPTGSVRMIARDPQWPIAAGEGDSAPGADSPAWQDVYESDRTRLVLTSSTAGSERYLVALVPWLRGKTVVGVIVGILDKQEPFLQARQLFSMEGYAAAVSLNGQEFFQFGPSAPDPAVPTEWIVEREALLAGASLGIRLWPPPGLLSLPWSRYSTALLLVGLLIALLTGSGVHLFLSGRRHLAEAEQATDELNRFFALSPDPLAILGMDSRIRRLNGAFAEGLGYAAEDLLDRPALDLVVPAERERAAGALAGLAQGTPVMGLLTPLQSKDGSWRWQSWRLVSDPARQLIYAAARDVTEQRNAEQALRESHGQLERLVQERTMSLTETVADLELSIAQRDVFQREMIASEARFRNLVEGSLQGIIVHRDFRPLFCNQAYAQMFGFEDPEEVLALDSLLPLIAEHEHARALGYLELRMRGDPAAPMEFELEGRSKDGELRWLLARARRIDWDGAPALQSTMVDITERKRAETSLGESEQHHRNMVNALPHALLIVGEDGRIADLNPQTTGMFGYERDELIGQPVELLVPERHRGGHVGLRNGYLHDPKTREMGIGLDLFGMRKDGSEFPVDVTLSPDRTQRGLQIICTVMDVTERRQLEAQMSASQKLETIGQLAGGVAHDFNNMLAVILSYANFVMAAVADQEAVREDVQQIIAAADRSAALTRQLLAFSRRQLLKLEDTDLNDIVTGMEKMLRRLIGEDVQFTTRLAPGLGIVKADASQMEQVLMNLTVNARDAMPLGGQLTIETANVELDEAYVNSHIEVEPGSYVMLSASDTGTGMDEATKARVFEPFFTTKELGKGTGLGLSTVYGIVKQLGGSIFVYSEPGRGTTFKIYLPRTAQSRAAAGAQAPAGRETRETGTILLVEDEEQVRAVARRILESAGYRVLAAADGNEAIALAERESGAIDLLLTDVVMPKMSGAELAARLLALRPGIPALYMTGYTEGAISEHGVLKEGVQVVFKPFSKASLLEQVRQALGTA